MRAFNSFSLFSHYDARYIILMKFMQFTVFYFIIMSQCKIINLLSKGSGVRIYLKWHTTLPTICLGIYICGKLYTLVFITMYRPLIARLMACRPLQC